ncbi:MAG: TetR/AcrR family transcriptional regulator [Bacteroidales bacterium]|jgi:AcrR family transcriptional regulator|nr:TetR/AcrR family transcriptional regulator [Bacteroidales bacterium]
MTSKSEDTREHILTVAFDMFMQKGYKGVTMSDLERMTGLTKGAFYHYFKDKAKIFSAALSEKFGKMEFRPDSQWLKDVSLHDFIEAYVTYLGKVIHYFHHLQINYADLQFSNIVLDAIRFIPDFKENVKRRSSEEITMWERVIFRAKENNEIKSDLETTVLSYTFLSLSHSVQKSIQTGKSGEHALSIIRLQFEQLYHLIKTS